MSIRSDLRNYLVSKTGITNLIASRIYPVRRPQAVTGDSICFWRTSGDHDHNLTGSSGTAIPSFAIDVLSDDYTRADAIAEAVRQVMQGFAGTMGTTVVKSVILVDEQDGYDDPADGSDKLTYRIALLYRIRYTESKPTP
jgi:hypothetical protein